MGIKFKGDLEKETLDNKIIEFETRLKIKKKRFKNIMMIYLKNKKNIMLNLLKFVMV